MLSIQDEVLPISILTGQEREAARDAGVEVQGGRRAKDGDRADGDEADAVLLREPAPPSPEAPWKRSTPTTSASRL